MKLERLNITAAIENLKIERLQDNGARPHVLPREKLLSVYRIA